MTDDVQTIPARRGVAARVAKGRSVKVVNTLGQQVVDTWAFNAHDLTEYMSMEHCRTAIQKLIPAVGDVLVTNRRRPILALVEDTTPGIHDTMIAACDSYRYQLLGCTSYHDNCTDNLAAAMAALGYRGLETPSPLNLFMNIPWTAKGALTFEPPTCKAGQYVVLQAEMDAIVAFSACPQDIVPINGRACAPTDAHFQIL